MPQKKVFFKDVFAKKKNTHTQFNNGVFSYVRAPRKMQSNENPNVGNYPLKYWDLTDYLQSK